ncbi:MAG: 3-isopropylmalate dehydratase [Alphaproteobacteria bacterium]|nr:3-isopropylmalate dehydratase [Alphaproteobacteria bacterium]
MIAGRVWKFGDDINTDLMLPGSVLYASEEEQKRAVFAANRPGWVDQVKPGDVLVGGRNFGMGSSRPAARSLRNLGLACVLAESINGLFFRNAVNFGLIALACPGVHAACEEGDRLELAIADWRASNARTGVALAVTPIPEALLKLMTGGGIYPHLEQRGLILPR